MAKETVAAVLRETLTSATVLDANHKPCTVADVLEHLAGAAALCGRALAAVDAPSRDATGLMVSSLAEAVMGATAAVVRVAAAVNDLAGAVRKSAVKGRAESVG